MGMDFPSEYKAWNSCDPVRLFDAPVEKFVPEVFIVNIHSTSLTSSQGMQQIEKTLKREARGCKKLILWLDCDREGENIAFEVIETCRQVAPGIHLFPRNP
jgi:DNA topoisomerase-3